MMLSAPSVPGKWIPLPEGDLSFVPDPLPPEPLLSGAVLAAVESARGAVSELVGQARLVANVDLISSALARREAVLSSRLEGTQTEIVEVLLQTPDRPPAEEDSDLYEVLNYVDTIRLAQEWLADGRELAPPLIKDLHARLLAGVRGTHKHPGRYRLKNVYIGNRERGFKAARFIPPPLEHVPALMDGLSTFTSGARAYGPMIDSALVHYQFATIHPFEDGNGRLGRLLIPLHLQQWGVLDRPLLYLSPYMEAHSDEYRDGLLMVSREGAWDAWISFFLEAIRATATDALERVKAIMELQSRYRALLPKGPPSKFSFPALDLIFDNVLVSARQISDAFSTSDPTARTIIDNFVRLGILELYGTVGRRQKRQMWIARELFTRVYES